MTMALVERATRRWSVAAQALVSLVAIVAVGVAFYYVLSFCGFEFEGI
jgi:hypothetical protein